jgi:hypothetical protein
MRTPFRYSVRVSTLWGFRNDVRNMLMKSTRRAEGVKKLWFDAPVATLSENVC